MRILNLNIGINLDNTEGVLKLIKSTKPDLATFQEVGNPLEEGCFKRFHSKIEIEKLFKFSAFAPLYCADKVTRGSEIVFEFGGKTEQGSLLVSNFKITSAENQFYYRTYQDHYDVTHFYEGEDWCRSLQNCTLEIDGKPLQILNVHGIYNPGKVGNDLTLAQIKFILSNVRFDIPCILIGDFNLVPETKEIREISNHLTNLSILNKLTSTRPPFKKQQVIDYIFINDKVKVNHFEMIDSEVSDHYPLVMDFDLQ